MEGGGGKGGRVEGMGYYRLFIYTIHFLVLNALGNIVIEVEVQVLMH